MLFHSFLNSQDNNNDDGDVKGGKGERDRSVDKVPPCKTIGLNSIPRIHCGRKHPHTCIYNNNTYTKNTIVIDEIFRRSQTFAQESVYEVVPVLITFWLP